MKSGKSGTGCWLPWAIFIISGKQASPIQTLAIVSLLRSTLQFLLNLDLLPSKNQNENIHIFSGQEVIFEIKQKLH